MLHASPSRTKEHLLVRAGHTLTLECERHVTFVRSLMFPNERPRTILLWKDKAAVKIAVTS